MSENLNQRIQLTNTEGEAFLQDEGPIEASSVDQLSEDEGSSADSNERPGITMPYRDPQTPEELIRELHQCTSRNTAKAYLQLLLKQMRAQITLFKPRFPSEDEDYFNHLNTMDELESFIHKLRLPLSDRLQEVLKRADHRVRVINRALDDRVLYSTPSSRPSSRS